MSYLVRDLAHYGRKNEALGIMKRNNVESYLKDYEKELLKDVVYDEATDTSINSFDEFGPIT